MQRPPEPCSLYWLRAAPAPAASAAGAPQNGASPRVGGGGYPAGLAEGVAGHALAALAAAEVPAERAAAFAAALLAGVHARHTLVLATLPVRSRPLP